MYPYNTYYLSNCGASTAEIDEMRATMRFACFANEISTRGMIGNSRRRPTNKSNVVK